MSSFSLIATSTALSNSRLTSYGGLSNVFSLPTGFSCNVSVGSNLTVAGDVTLSNGLSVYGNAIVAGTSYVSGAATFSNAVIAAGALTTLGASTLSNGLTVFGVATTLSNNLNLSGNAIVAGTSYVSGAATFSNAVIAAGALNVIGASVLSNGLTVYGVAAFSNTVNASGALTVAGNVGIGTASPAFKLDVVGGATSVSSGVSGLPATTGAAQTAALALRLRGNDNGVLDFGVNGGLGSWLQSCDRSTLSGGYSLLLNPNGGNVGVGTSNPTYKLDVIAGTGNGGVQTGLRVQTQVGMNGTTADAILIQQNTGEGNSKQAITWYNGQPSNPFRMASVWSEVGLAYTAPKMGFDVADASRAMQTRMVIDVGGNVGIGTSSPAYKLDVAGDVNVAGVIRTTNTANNKKIVLYDDNAAESVATGTTFYGFGVNGGTLRYQSGGVHAWYSTTTSTMTLDGTGNLTCAANITAYSDARLKDDIRPLADSLSKIDRIGGYTYTRKDIQSSVRYAGVLAHEVREVLPEVVHENADGYLSVSYGNMVALLVEGIKELNGKLAELQTTVADQGGIIVEQREAIRLLSIALYT